MLMKTLLCSFSVLTGFFLGFLGLVAGSDTLISFFTDAHPLTMSIGHLSITSENLLGKLVGALLCCILLWLAKVFVISLPDKLWRRHVA